MSKSCPKCQSTNIETDGSRGEAVCTNCGHVLEECAIVSEVQFSESAGGQSSVVGQFVPEHGLSGFRGAPGYGGFSKESREVTLANGKRIIQHIAGCLRLASNHVDVAHRFFQQAVQKNFIQGRRTNSVVAACLYIVCRRLKTSHMLIDFAEVLQIDVYDLGNVFLKFCKELHIKLDPIDPSLYIRRFASMLEFDDKTHQVAHTALRIVARMNREWMITGRRPAGICGAGLIIAAKMHGFNRTETQIAQVVRICDGTLKKRLTEFDETGASDLTVSEFNSLFKAGSATDFVDDDKYKEEESKWWWDSKCAPPSMKNQSKKKKTPSALSSRSQSLSEISVEGLQDQAERALAESAELQELDREPANALTCDPLLMTRSGREGLQQKGGGGDGAGIRVRSSPVESPRREDDGQQAIPSVRVEDEEEEESVNLSEVDDDEINSCLRTPEEAAHRAIVWDEMNREYLEQQAERQKLAEIRGIPSGSQRRKRKAEEEFVGSTAAEATAKMLKNKNLSDKVNYAALEELLGPMNQTV